MATQLLIGAWILQPRMLLVASQVLAQKPRPPFDYYQSIFPFRCVRPPSDLTQRVCRLQFQVAPSLCVLSQLGLLPIDVLPLLVVSVQPELFHAQSLALTCPTRPVLPQLPQLPVSLSRHVQLQLWRPPPPLSASVQPLPVRSRCAHFQACPTQPALQLRLQAFPSPSALPLLSASVQPLPVRSRYAHFQSYPAQLVWWLLLLQQFFPSPGTLPQPWPLQADETHRPQLTSLVMIQLLMLAQCNHQNRCFGAYHHSTLEMPIHPAIGHQHHGRVATWNRGYPLPHHHLPHRSVFVHD